MTTYKHMLLAALFPIHKKYNKSNICQSTNEYFLVQAYNILEHLYEVRYCYEWYTASQNTYFLNEISQRTTWNK